MAVSAAATLFAWVSFDAARTAEGAGRYFQQTYQRKLLLGTPPTLSLWPRPALRFERLALSEPGQDETFASAEQLRVELAWLPLFERRFEITGLRVDNLALRLREDASGRWNAADLFAPAPASAPEGWRWQADRLELRGARAAIEPAGRSAPYLLEDFSLRARTRSAERPGHLQLQARLLDRREETDLLLRGEAALRLADGLRAGRLDALDLRLDGDTHDVKGTTQRLGAERLEWRQGGQEGSVHALQVRLRGADGPQALEFQASLPELAWQGYALSGKSLKARVDLRTVAQHGGFSLELPELVAEPAAGFHSPDARFEWQHEGKDGTGATAHLQGTLQASLRAGELRFDDGLGELTLRHPLLDATRAPGRLSGRFDWQRGRSTLLGTASFGDDALQLHATFDSLSPLVGRVDLDSERFDLDRLLAPAERRKDATLPWPDWPGLALDARLRLLDLRVGGLAIDSLSGPLSLRGGQLSSDGLRARLAGGDVRARLASDTGARQLSAEGEFTTLRLEALAPQGTLPLSGLARGSFALGLTLTPGQPPLQGLAGNIRWQAERASLRGVDLARGLEALSPAILAGRMGARGGAAQESSELGDASGRFVLAGGRLTAENLASRNAWLRLAGGGGADLVSGEIDLRLTAELQAAAPRTLAALRGKPVPLRIKGAPRAPDLRYEPTPARSTS